MKEADPGATVVADAEAAPFEAWLAAGLAHFEARAAAELPPAGREPARLHEAMRYAALGAGKRVRPLLVYGAGECCGAGRRDAALDSAALAVEFVHVYSLIHDDLPCMDDDVLRRGRPTVHVAYDEATAMLAGDALQAEAFRVLADAPVAAETRAALMGELAHAAGTAGMCGGQAIDLASTGRLLALAELEAMHRKKTGALLLASVRMGALAAGADAATLTALDRYGRAIGLAFQIVDDVLDVEGTSDVLGKTAGKDARQNKPTYVSVLGVDAARQRAERLRHEALEALAPLGPASRSGRTLRLRQLADFIVLRSF
jgi:farnesyl diphosphate synthase